jgi:acetylornithine/succinyldiaminopimelate/putrescine aminotransferase
MGFIVTLPMYQDVLTLATLMPRYDELQKAKIHQADYVFVCNSSAEAVEFLQEYIIWAEDLQKKIMYEYEEKQTDED